MKVIKFLFWMLLAIVLLLAIALFIVASNLNSIVVSAVEEVGSDTLKTEVRLKSADISLLGGSAELKGLTISNPAGFSAGNAFELDKVFVSLNPEGLPDKLIGITEVTIDGTRINAEQKGLNTNLQALLKNLQQGSSKPASNEDEALDVLIKVDQFAFTNSALELKSEQLGTEQLELLDIKLDKIGGENGLPPDQLAKSVLKPLLSQINRAVKKQLEGKIKDKAKEKLREKEDELKNKLRSKLQDKLGDRDAKSAEKALKSLFK